MYFTFELASIKSAFKIRVSHWVDWDIVDMFELARLWLIDEMSVSSMPRGRFRDGENRSPPNSFEFKIVHYSGR